MSTEITIFQTTDIFEVAKQENTPKTSADLDRILCSENTKALLTLINQVVK